MVAHAARHGWLAALAAGAVAANPTPALKEAVDHLLAPDDGRPPPPLHPDLRPYLAWMAQQSERLALSLLDPSGAKTARLELAKVFINLNATPRAWRLPEEPAVTVRERAALAAVHAARRLILLGDPGSGKSTLLRFLVYCLAQHALTPADGWLAQLQWQRERLRAGRRGTAGQRRDEAEAGETEDHHWTADAPLPVFIELRDFARSDFDPDAPLALWRYVAQQLAGRGLEAAVDLLAAQAQAGNVIFLLDGVDEAPLARRRDVWRAIAALADGVYGRCRWVATCRILSFDAQEAPEGVGERTLQPLTEAQIADFIGCWYGVLAEMGELSAARAESLTGHLR